MYILLVGKINVSIQYMCPGALFGCGNSFDSAAVVCDFEVQYHETMDCVYLLHSSASSQQVI